VCRNFQHVLTPDLYEGDKDNAEPRSLRGYHLDFPITARQSDTPPLDFPSRYAQAFSIMTSMFGLCRLRILASVGSYGTRNIVVIGMMVFGATDRVYSIDLSKFYSSGVPPFRGGFA
jgi:hypothetical protein